MNPKNISWNPVLNALAAAAYICVVATLIHYISTVRHDTPDTVFDSIAFLSLFVFSASVMAFLFFYRPAVLLIEKNASAALAYFFKTLASFGVITLIAIATMLALS